MLERLVYLIPQIIILSGFVAVSSFVHKKVDLIAKQKGDKSTEFWEITAYAIHDYLNNAIQYSLIPIILFENLSFLAWEVIVFIAILYSQSRIESETSVVIKIDLFLFFSLLFTNYVSIKTQLLWPAVLCYMIINLIIFMSEVYRANREEKKNELTEQMKKWLSS